MLHLDIEAGFWLNGVGQAWNWNLFKFAIVKVLVNTFGLITESIILKTKFPLSRLVEWWGKGVWSSANYIDATWRVDYLAVLQLSRLSV